MLGDDANFSRASPRTADIFGAAVAVRETAREMREMPAAPSPPSRRAHMALWEF